MILLDFLNLCF